MVKNKIFFTYLGVHFSEEVHILAFKHSRIQAFSHSSIQAFKHSSIQAFKHSNKHFHNHIIIKKFPYRRVYDMGGRVFNGLNNIVVVIHCLITH